MEKIKVGIDSDQFYSWGGGVDFIATLTYALESSGKTETFLIIQEDSCIIKILKYLRIILKALLGKGNFFAGVKKYNSRYDDLINGFTAQSPNTKFIYYSQSKINYRKKIEKCLQKNGIDILLPVCSPLGKDFKIPWISYIFDFQHKYLDNLFTDKEKEYRDNNFANVLSKSNHVLVNAQAVKYDIEKYYPSIKTDVIVLPFLPFILPFYKKKSLAKYKLPEKYFIVCSQFWEHKSHITVFEALEELYTNGSTDVHVVCTGKTEDYRNPNYISSLKQRIDSMKCKKNIHLLGYIPKEDQLQIMDNSLGLIQPSLFEGGAGAGGVLYALGMGLQCFVSDIDVNKEIIGFNNVFFFEKQNSLLLAKLLKEHINDKKRSMDIVSEQFNKNRIKYADVLLTHLHRCIDEWSE